MMEDPLKWSAQLNVAPQSHTTKRLAGDRITLPQTALEGLLAAAPIVSVQNGTQSYTRSFDPFNQYSFAAESRAREAFADRQQQLPHPLTFKLVNPQNGRSVYAGIREFSSEEGEIGLSAALQESLGLKHGSSRNSRSSTPQPEVDITGVDDLKSERITVHYSSVPKGTYVKLRPLEAGYDPEDWKSLLERYLRDNFTTLTTGEVFTVNASRNEKFSFLVDKVSPEGDAICVIDTDLEVDIEPMSEEQARETLNKKLTKARKAPGTASGSSTGGTITLGQEVRGQVLPGEYVDYNLKAWDKNTDLEMSTSTEEGSDVDIFVNPFSGQSRALPRLDEYMFGDFSDRSSKRLKLSHTNVELESSEHVNISIHAWRSGSDTSDNKPIPFSLTVSSVLSGDSSIEPSQNEEPLADDDFLCKNCMQHIPKRTKALHEAFCYRNNVSCPKCHAVFLKNSEAWKSHWHCPDDEAFGTGQLSKLKHDSLLHPKSTLICPGCEFEAFNMPILAQHRTSTCPSKEILCQFCHLLVPQQGPDDPLFTDAEVLLSGMTPHEYADGARTTECHICSRIVRLRDMRTHLRFHDRERVSRVLPQMCTNQKCGRTIKLGDEARVSNEQFGLCNECFGPLYVTSHDPEGKMLRRRVERRLLQQLMSGCGKSWCQNAEWCKTGHKNSTGEERPMSARDALPKVKPVLEQLAQGINTALQFCVDEATQTRRAIAEMIAAEGVYELAWCIKALEEAHNDFAKARTWLNDRAPKINEVPS